MSVKNAANQYKQNDREYIKGIETPHGRIKIIYETILINLDQLANRHPKTDFVSFGKCINALKILSSSILGFKLLRISTLEFNFWWSKKNINS